MSVPPENTPDAPAEPATSENDEYTEATTSSENFENQSYDTEPSESENRDRNPHIGSSSVTPIEDSSSSAKYGWDNFWSRVVQVLSLLAAIVALFLAWFAFKIPLENANVAQKREQATKISVSVESHKCPLNSGQAGLCGNRKPGEIFWESKVINSSDAPIYNVIARVTPKQYENKGAALGSYVSQSGYQVLPNDELAIGRGSSTFNDNGSKLVKYSVTYAFTDATGMRWYAAYDVDQTSADVESLYQVKTKLTNERPEDWPLTKK